MDFDEYRINRIIMKNLNAFLLMAFFFSLAQADEPSIRYRGQFTLGHDVSTFCPEGNTRCYWISPNTAPEQRQHLEQLSVDNTSTPFESVCIAVEGSIDRDPAARKSIGFAVDYDGLLRVNGIFGLCENTSIVTQGDLKHHRWILESINGKKIDTEKLGNKVPELNFGAHMMASGNTGCNHFSGKAVLREDRFVIEAMSSTEMFCSAGRNELEQLLARVLSSESVITIDEEKNLLLDTGTVLLQYRLKDRVY